MGHGYKIPTIKPSKNPNRSISEIVKERGRVVKREVELKKRESFMFCPQCGNLFSIDPKASKYCGYCRIKSKLKEKESEKSAKRNRRVGCYTAERSSPPAEPTRAVEKQAETDSRDSFWNSIKRPPMWGKAYWNYKVKGCFNCKFYRRLQDCKNLDEESFEMFIYTTFKTGICNNYRPEEIEVMDLTPEQRRHYERIQKIMEKKAKRIFGYNKIKEEWRKML